MFRRKLKALKYQLADSFEFDVESNFKNVVVWLEDHKIRHYKIEDRDALRKLQNPDWQEVFTQYLKDLECPVIDSDATTILDWLLGLAVGLEYGDHAEKYKSITAASLAAKKLDQPQMQSDNPLDKLNFDDPDFKAGVTSLAQLLQIPRHPDHLVTLKAVTKLISERLSPDALEAAKSNIPSETVKPLPLANCVLGFETGDYVMSEAAKILRLLHIRELRELQTRINEAIVAAQAITANPRTDERLGKVGR
ncbi:PREDICTED: UPF0568 protein C14orf166 homolog isoform X1 [Priapulus caudatus]|uniref:UPF0568 protein C14orf166 homolog isoform X1 n=1 Tax=Priapulus caudatus TaxID=37621 RepID=A0ABM1EI50_PRICU|nr:PREDICTED: UPF0568 protein C14orf166 homolog isoform X1 [Priapulus caudatus]